MEGKLPMTSENGRKSASRIVYPEGLKQSGRELYKDVLSRLRLNLWEVKLLVEACRTVDRLEDLNTEIEDADGKEKQKLLVEARLQQATLGRLISSLRFPESVEDDSMVRPQRRGSYRGNYGRR